MTLELTYILRPLIGAVIGYITNDIAIRMLFRPRTAKYVFGMKVPFTPGIIPKEKPRIAASIGDAISKNLMNKDVIEKTLLSEDMIAKICTAIDGFVATQMANEECVRDFLAHYVSEDDLTAITANISEDLSGQIHSALANADLGPKIAHMVTEHVLDKVRGGLLGTIGADQFLGLIAKPVETLLAKNINQMLFTRSAEMVSNLIDGQISAFMQMPMKELFVGREEQIGQAKQAIVALYRNLISEQLPKILEAVNISRIVESRINEMDVRESEALIFQVMKKELKAIVWLGALLGFIMGCVNLLF